MLAMYWMGIHQEKIPIYFTPMFQCAGCEMKCKTDAINFWPMTM